MKSIKRQLVFISILMVLVIAALTLGGLQLFGKGKAKPSEWFKKTDMPQAEQAVPETFCEQKATVTASVMRSTLLTVVSDMPSTLFPAENGWELIEGSSTNRTPMSVFCGDMELKSNNSIVNGKFFIYAMCYRRDLSSVTGSSIGNYQYAYYFVVDFSEMLLSDKTPILSNGYSDFRVRVSGNYVDFTSFENNKMYAICYSNVQFANIATFINDTNSVICCTKPVSLPETPTKEGYTFNGWYYGTQSEHGENCIKYNDEPIYEDTNLHAHWKINTYTVSFDVNGGSYLQSETVEWNTALTPPTPTRTGYNFVGWYLADGTKYENQSITKNVTLTAHWQIKTFKVMFFVDGEKFAEQTVEYGSTLAAAMEQAEIVSYKAMSTDGVRLSKLSSVITEDTQVLVQELTGWEKYGDFVARSPWFTWLTVGVIGVLLIISVVGIVMNVKRR